MNSSRHAHHGFSLVEVVVAVGVFVAGVVGALALLSSTTTQTNQVRDVLTATRVGESTLAWLRTQTAPDITTAVAAGEDGAYQADRDGRRFSWHEPLAIEEAHFLVLIEETGEGIGADESGQPLGTRHRLRVEWPLWQSPGVRAAAAEREAITFNLFVRR